MGDMKTKYLVRAYQPETDYPSLEFLLKDGDTFGGQFDEARDTKDRIDSLSITKPGSVLVAEYAGVIIGTVTSFEDGRSAWLYRFAIKPQHTGCAEALFEHARAYLKQRGHTQVLVYAPKDNSDFELRYTNLGFIKGNDFTAYWQNII